MATIDAFGSALLSNLARCRLASGFQPGVGVANQIRAGWAKGYPVSSFSRHMRPILAALLLAPLCAGAADLYNGVASPIAEPECIVDAGSAMVAGGATPADRFMLVVRHMGD